ncbi:ATP-dependent zinc protease family protein [Cysteiniphilum halobium]|uniref:ATP-dependent zinc protease family protein n=1 Tax=Cysteiniphilum halobium TaxID=2219059 RepID=UPI0013C2EC73|nr:RimK/LysX family protein [Cysteiniphilum halobium]
MKVNKIIKYLGLSTMLVTSTAMANIKTGYGYVENVYLLPSKTLLDAKLDTGAGISSVSATNIHVYEKGDKKYVRFDVTHEAIEQQGKRNKDKIEKVAYDLPLKRMMNIKNRAGEDKKEQYDERPVVEMPICFDGKIYTIEVNLTDRTHFDYPVLLGRKALIQLGAVIDPAQKFTMDDSACEALFEKIAKEEKKEKEAKEEKINVGQKNDTENAADSKPTIENDASEKAQ